METVAPNVKELLTVSGCKNNLEGRQFGPTCGLIAATIQILGAEKALFRALRPEPAEAWVAVPASSHSFCAQVAR